MCSRSAPRGHVEAPVSHLSSRDAADKVARPRSSRCLLLGVEIGLVSLWITHWRRVDAFYALLRWKDAHPMNYLLYTRYEARNLCRTHEIIKSPKTKWPHFWKIQAEKANNWIKTDLFLRFYNNSSSNSFKQKHRLDYIALIWIK